MRHKRWRLGDSDRHRVFERNRRADRGELLHASTRAARRAQRRSHAVVRLVHSNSGQRRLSGAQEAHLRNLQEHESDAQLVHRTQRCPQANVGRRVQRVCALSESHLWHFFACSSRLFVVGVATSCADQKSSGLFDLESSFYPIYHYCINISNWLNLFLFDIFFLLIWYIFSTLFPLFFSLYLVFILRAFFWPSGENLLFLCGLNGLILFLFSSIFFYINNFYSTFIKLKWNDYNNFSMINEYATNDTFYMYWRSDLYIYIYIYSYIGIKFSCSVV